MGWRKCKAKTLSSQAPNSGIGLETAKTLAGMGASILITCRSNDKGKSAADEISKHANGATVQTAEVDLGSMASVRKGAEEIGSKLSQIDVLINNAGVFPPTLRKTADGFEEQIGVNHLGPFLLTHLLQRKT